MTTGTFSRLKNTEAEEGGRVGQEPFGILAQKCTGVGEGKENVGCLLRQRSEVVTGWGKKGGADDPGVVYQAISPPEVQSIVMCNM